MNNINLESLPFPVAYPLYFTQSDKGLDTSKADNLIFAAYQAMRVTALLLLADYLRSDDVDPALASPIRGLRMPHWQEWSILCDKLAQYWSTGGGKAEASFPTLAEAWLRVNPKQRKPSSPWYHLLESLPGMQGPACGPNDALWKLRNDRYHRRGTQTPQQTPKDAERVERYLPLVKAMVQELFPPGAFTLMRCVSQTDASLDVIRLHGPHPDLKFAPEPLAQEWSGAFSATGVAVLTGENSVPVFPLFLSSDDLDKPQGLPAGGGLTEPLLLVDGVSHKRIFLLGVERFVEDTKHVDALTKALQAKQVDIGLERDKVKPWTIAEWSRVTCADELAAIRCRKYFPDWYVERPDMEATLAGCLQQSGRALLLLGEAGSGKSSLLARLVERLIADPREAPGDGTGVWQHLETRGSGDVVLYLTGRAAYEGDSYLPGRALLCEAMVRRTGIRAGAFSDLADFLAHLDASNREDTDPDRKVWLILDGLNEASRFVDWVKALDALLPSMARYCWLRLVITMRTGAYQSLRQRDLSALQHGAPVFGNEQHLFTFAAQGLNETVPFLELRPFTSEEAAQAYTLRQRYAPERACRAAFDRLTAAIRRLIESPLLLHLFHETFAGLGEPPRDLDETALLDAYLESLSRDLPGMKDTLDRIGRLMLERHSPKLPVDIADDWLKDWRTDLGFTSRGSVTKLDPIEELVSASILLRPAEEGFGTERSLQAFQFTHQRLAEQVLARTLLEAVKPRPLPDPDTFLARARAAVGSPDRAPFPELEGALDHWLHAGLQLPPATGDDLLLPLLDRLAKDESSAVRYFVQAFLASLLRRGVVAPKDLFCIVFREGSEELATAAAEVFLAYWRDLAPATLQACLGSLGSPHEDAVLARLGDIFARHFIDAPAEARTYLDSVLKPVVRRRDLFGAVLDVAARQRELQFVLEFGQRTLPAIWDRPAHGTALRALLWKKYRLPINALMETREGKKGSWSWIARRVLNPLLEKAGIRAWEQFGAGMPMSGNKQFFEADRGVVQRDLMRELVPYVVALHNGVLTGESLAPGQPLRGLILRMLNHRVTSVVGFLAALFVPAVLRGRAEEVEGILDDLIQETTDSGRFFANLVLAHLTYLDPDRSAGILAILHRRIVPWFTGWRPEDQINCPLNWEWPTLFTLCITAVAPKVLWQDCHQILAEIFADLDERGDPATISAMGNHLLKASFLSDGDLGRRVFEMLIEDGRLENPLWRVTVLKVAAGLLARSPALLRATLKDAQVDGAIEREARGYLSKVVVYHRDTFSGQVGWDRAMVNMSADNARLRYLLIQNLIGGLARAQGTADIGVAVRRAIVNTTVVIFGNEPDERYSQLSEDEVLGA